MDELKTLSLSQAPQLRVLGRSDGNLHPLTVYWTAGGIELSLRGRELWVEAEADYTTSEPWITVVVDGAPAMRTMVAKGRQWLPVFRGMDSSAAHHVLLLKDSQDMPEDPRCSLRLHNLRFQGELLPLPEPKLRLEFIGDSITSGEGSLGAPEQGEWLPMWFSAYENYAFQTAQRLGAWCRILSQSGWGVLTGWDNNPHTCLPPFYTQVCGVAKGGALTSGGGDKPNDFAAWQPDMVVINLGTNDLSAFNTPAWIDPDTGSSYKQRSTASGDPLPEDMARLEQAMVDFLKLLRRCNPNAHLLWAYGMLGAGLMPTIQRAVNRFLADGGDNASVFQLPQMLPDGLGARNHPGWITHRRTADALAEHIALLLAGRG